MVEAAHRRRRVRLQGRRRELPGEGGARLRLRHAGRARRHGRGARRDPAGTEVGHGYAVDPDREGELLWQYRAGQGSIWGGIQWGISAPTFIPGVLFSGSNDGGIRARAKADGSVIWEYDTNRDFETLNRVRANGGAIQGPGPTIVGGMMYVNSGYGDHLGRPGNVLLAFGLP
jgi:outer membrane protein assembly factor BamB